jgi:hypothetical protein
MKKTLPVVIPTKSDDLYIPVTARAARIYTPDYSTLTNTHWTKIVASACLPYNPILHLAALNCGGGVSVHRSNYIVTSLSLSFLVDKSGDHK